MKMKIKASDKDRILSILKEKTSLFSSELDGDKALNTLILKSLKEDGLITIRDSSNDNMLVIITDIGKASISCGGYSLEAKRRKRENIKTTIISSITFILGIVIDKLLDILLPLLFG